jgi:hypothetical protein
MSPDPQDLEEILDDILRIQSDRAEAYTRLDQGFRSYMAKASETRYSEALKSLTSDFQSLSHRVLAAEARLKDAPNLDLAAVVRSIQDAERRKLELTIGLHAARAASEQRHEKEADSDVLRSREGIHSCCTTHEHEDFLLDSDAKVAIKEIYKELETTVGTLNAAIQELMEARLELQSQRQSRV